MIKTWSGDRSNYLRGDYLNGNGTISQLVTPVSGEFGTMVSFNHNLKKLGEGDQGGPWLLQKAGNFVVKSFWPRSKFGGYSGDVTAWPADSLLFYSDPSDASLDADGAVAISATLPTTPEWSASTFLAESLQDGVPKMVGVETWREKTLRAKQAGSEYLNVQYGWLPFVSDIQGFAHSVRNSSEIVHDFKKNANHPIRRRFRFKTEYTTDSHSENHFIKAASSVSLGSTMTHFSRQKTIKKWFSGAYIYYLPVDDSTQSRFKRYAAYADKLLGVKPTPETVWNASPWSWAVDWKTDVGNVIRNYSQIGNDGLVLQYGYLMYQLDNASTSVSKYGIWESYVHHKIRVPANPYGFGVDLSKLSARQISILAALGLSHGR